MKILIEAADGTDSDPVNRGYYLPHQVAQDPFVAGVLRHQPDVAVGAGRKTSEATGCS